MRRRYQLLAALRRMECQQRPFTDRKEEAARDVPHIDSVIVKIRRN